MNNKEISALKGYAICLFMAVLVIALGFMWVKLRDTQMKLAELEKGTNKSFNAQQAQIDGINTNIEGLQSNTDALKQDIERLDQDLAESKKVQSNTISALTRLRKQKDELEKKLEEGLELRKQRLAEMRAWASGGSSSSSGGWSGIGGVFELTAYEWTGRPCANGEYPIPGYTVASNWFPIGTRIYIEGIGERVVTDTGGMSNNVIDIYMGDPETCIQFGRQTAEVYVIED